MRTGLLFRDVAEIALEANSRAEFRREALSRICQALSADAGAINRVTTRGELTVDAHGLSAELLRPALPAYLSEITSDEFARVLRSTAVVDAEIFSPARRDSLRLYRDYLVPGGVYGFCARMWSNRHGCFWVTLSRQGRHARYGAGELQALEALRPILTIGELLHDPPAEPRACASHHAAWVRGQGLTPSECAVVGLLDQGLTNPQIATVLGRSPNTVRNQLAAAYQKLGASNRAECVAVLANAGGVASVDSTVAIPRLQHAITRTGRPLGVPRRARRVIPRSAV